MVDALLHDIGHATASSESLWHGRSHLSCWQFSLSTLSPCVKPKGQRPSHRGQVGRSNILNLTHLSSRLEPRISLQKTVASSREASSFPRSADPGPNSTLFNLSDAAKEAPIMCRFVGSRRQASRALCPRRDIGRTSPTPMHVVLAIGVDNLVMLCALAQGFSSAAAIPATAARLVQRG